MYRENDEKQTELEDFYLPFAGHLDEENRWAILEQDYKNKLSGSEQAAPAKTLRMAPGSLINKEKLQISDREVVQQICETPDLQYFIGKEAMKIKNLLTHR